MPGPLHGGIVDAVRWAPGAGAAGVKHTLEIGPYGEDVILARILNISGGASTSTADLTVIDAKTSNKRSHFEGFPTDSLMFASSTYNQLVPEFGIRVPAGQQAKFKITHAGTDNLVWEIFICAPAVDQSLLQEIRERMQ